MIESEIDYCYFEDTDSLDELDGVLLHDESGKHEDIEYVRKDRASGDTSDGYHTFDELYEHRTGLLAALCNTLVGIMADEGLSPNDMRMLLFKSRQHHDGDMYDGMFIVGINCNQKPGPWAQWATWHCESEWWDRFAIPELDKAPEWDGHTPEEALARLVRCFTPEKEEK